MNGSEIGNEKTIELEKALLSAIMHDQEILFRIKIKPEDMILPDHTRILSSCIKLAEAGFVPNLQSVCNDLRESVNPAYISEITSFGSASVNWMFYAKQLKEAIMIKRLKKTQGVIDGLIQSETTASDVVQKTGEYIDSVALGFSEYKIEVAKDIIMEWHDGMEKKIGAKGDITGIPTGFQKIDDITGGWKDRYLIYIGARPSQGKSAILYNMAISALKGNKRVGVISVESSKNEIMDRMISSHARVPMHGIKTGRMNKTAIAQVAESEVFVYESPLYIYDEPNANIMTVIAQARRMVIVHKIDVLFVDYCQLISPANRSMSRIDQVSDISIKLKSLARDLNIPIVCAAQLRRDAENRTPQLSDFADTSQIEKDADIAILIHHKAIEQDGEVERYDSFLHIDKHRDGQTDSIPVVFQKDIVTFYEKGID